MVEKEDKELVEAFKNNQNRNDIFREIVLKYQKRLYYHIRKIVIIHEDTDDVLQNTFVKAWKGLDNFQQNSELFTWLYRIATNESLTFLQQKRKKHQLPLSDYEPILENSLESDEYFSGNEIQLRLQKAILQLPEKQRIVFNMKYFEDITYEQMSEILETSVGALKSSYHIAVKKIEESLKLNQ